MHLSIVLGLLLGTASAATTSSSFCASAKACPTSATAFCSSYLHIPAKTTTVTPTVTVTKTSTLVSGATTKTSYTSTSTWVFTRTSSDFSTTTTTATYTSTSYSCTNSYYGGVCTFSGTDPNALQKRAEATPASPRPSCLASYPSGPALSSACKCLSVATSTATVTKRQAVTKTSVKTVTKPKTTTTNTYFSIIYTTTTEVLTGTVTSTEYVATVTASVTGNAGTAYLLVSGSAPGNPSGLASDFETTPDGGTGIQFSQPYAGHADSFYMGYFEETPCVLSSYGGGAPYAFIGATGDSDIIEFTSDAVPAEQLVVCRQSLDTSQLFCKHPQGTTYNAGYLDADKFWHIPINSSEASAYIIAENGNSGYACASS